MTMKNLTFGLIVIISLINVSCRKDKIDPNIEELEIFKNQTEIQFTGTVLGNEINWTFDNWENGIGATYGRSWNLTNDTTIQQFSFEIYDVEKSQEIEHLEIKSPAFSSNDTYSFKKSLFESGVKKFHSMTSTIYEGFEITVYSKNSIYWSSYGEQKNSTFNIIKVQELAPNPQTYEPAKLRLWIVLSCNLYNGNEQKVGEIKDGKYISEVSLETNKF